MNNNNDDQKPILVIGATGYLAGWLIPLLLTSGYNLRAMGRSITKMADQPWGQILQEGPVPTTVLRAAMILGSGSARFEILRYLAERLPVMVTPKWVRMPTQPISITNVLGYLKGCMEHPETRGKTFDIGGPNVVTYRDLFRIFAKEAGLPAPVMIPVPVLTPKLSSLWIHLVTPVPAAIAQPLAEG